MTRDMTPTAWHYDLAINLSDPMLDTPARARILAYHTAPFIDLLRDIEESGFLNESRGDESGGHLLAEMRALLRHVEG